MESLYLHSFEVHDLLASFFDFGFHGEAEFGDLGALAGDACGFGEQGVGFAIHFLKQEVEFLAGFSASDEDIAEVLDVGFHAGDLFGDVAALDQQGHFFEEALAIDTEGAAVVTDGGFEAFGEALLIACFDCRVGGWRSR